MSALPITPICAILALVPIVIIPAVTVVNAFPCAGLSSLRLRRTGSEDRNGRGQHPHAHCHGQKRTPYSNHFHTPATTPTSERNKEREEAGPRFFPDQLFHAARAAMLAAFGGGAHGRFSRRGNVFAAGTLQDFLGALHFVR